MTISQLKSFFKSQASTVLYCTYGRTGEWGSRVVRSRVVQYSMIRVGRKITCGSIIMPRMPIQ